LNELSLKTVQELFEEGEIRLGGGREARIDSRILLCKSASITDEEFYAEGRRELAREQERKFFRLIDRRRSGIPLAYLTNVKEFWSLSFDVRPGVLIPRPETELIVEKIIALSSKRGEVVADIGTGCGNIAIALAGELPEARIIATDVSLKAVRIAKANAARMGFSNIAIVQGSMFSPLKRLKLRGACDFIVSNPPYVAEREWTKLPLEIRRHEPKKALVAGETGLELIQELVKGAPEYLKPAGHLVFEIGDGQSKQVMPVLGGRWIRVRSFKDLSGIPRVIAAQKPAT